MDKSMAIQYTIVSVIVMIALIWLYLRLRRSNKKGHGSCSGCALSDKCGDSKRLHNKKNCNKPH